MAFIKKMFVRSQSLRDMDEDRIESILQNDPNRSVVDPNPANWVCRINPLDKINHSHTIASKSLSSRSSLSKINFPSSLDYHNYLHHQQQQQHHHQHQQSSSSSSSLSSSSKSPHHHTNIESIIMNEYVFDQILIQKSDCKISMVLHLTKGFLLTASEDGRVSLWHLTSGGQYCGTRQLHDKAVCAWLTMMNRKDESGILVTASWNKSIQAVTIPSLSMSLADIKREWVGVVIVKEKTTTESLSLSSDKEEDVEMEDNQNRIWREFNCKTDCIFIQRPHNIRCLLEMKNNQNHQRFIVSGGDGLKLWNLNGDLLDQLDASLFDCEDVSKLLRVDEDLFVCAFHKFLYMIKITFVPTEGIGGMFRGHSVSPTTFMPRTYTSKGQMLHCLRRLTQHQEPVRVLTTFHAHDAASFLSASLDGAILLWTGSSVATPKALFNAYHNYAGQSRGYPFSVQSVQVFCNQLLLVSIGNGFDVFDCGSGLKLFDVKQAHVGKTSDVRLLNMSSPHGMGPSGDIIISCGEDGRIRVWGLNESRLVDLQLTKKDLEDVNQPFFLGIPLSVLVRKVLNQGGKPIVSLLTCYQELLGHSSGIQALLPIHIAPLSHTNNKVVNNNNNNNQQETINKSPCHGFLSYSDCNEIIYWRFRPIFEASCLNFIRHFITN